MLPKRHLESSADKIDPVVMMKRAVIQLVKGLCTYHLQLTWHKGKLRIRFQPSARHRPLQSKLDDAPSSLPTHMGSKQASMSMLTQDDIAHIHGTLSREVRKHRQARQIFRHLIYCERTLRKSGTAGLFELPSRVLQSAVQQLALLQNSSNYSALVDLRECLETVIHQREHDEDALLSGVCLKRDVSIKEASFSDFLKFSSES